MEEEQQFIDNLEELIHAWMVKDGVDLKEMFHDFDGKRNLHVTLNQFHRVMSTIGFSLTEEEVSVLGKKHCDMGNDRDFNYVSFLASVARQPFYPRQEMKARELLRQTVTRTQHLTQQLAAA